MNHDWQPYLCNVNSKLASIFVNLGYRGENPDPSRPWLLWVWIKLKSPRPDGLSTWEEFDSLGALEKRLTQSLAQECNAVLSGTITTLGRREFYYYGQNPELLRAAVDATMKTFHAYEFEWGSQEDPNWNQYKDVLSPSDEQMQSITNRKVLDNLQDRGDLLTESRDVWHWAYFKSASDRAEFKNVAAALGYRIQSEHELQGMQRNIRLAFVLSGIKR